MGKIVSNEFYGGIKVQFIRQATIKDKEMIYNLLVQLEGMEFDKRMYSDIYEANLLNPAVFYFVYEEENSVVGFISIHIQKLLHHSGNIAEVQELIVDESVRGKGIGKQLFEKARLIAIENKCSQLEVCCNQKRKESHQFYELQGMTNNHYKFCLVV